VAALSRMEQPAERLGERSQLVHLDRVEDSRKQEVENAQPPKQARPIDCGAAASGVVQQCSARDGGPLQSISDRRQSRRSLRRNAGFATPIALTKPRSRRRPAIA